jgi:hypothetical protein
MYFRKHIGHKEGSAPDSENDPSDSKGIQLPSFNLPTFNLDSRMKKEREKDEKREREARKERDDKKEREEKKEKEGEEKRGQEDRKEKEIKKPKEEKKESDENKERFDKTNDERLERAESFVFDGGVFYWRHGSFTENWVSCKLKENEKTFSWTYFNTVSKFWNLKIL